MFSELLLRGDLLAQYLPIVYHHFLDGNKSIVTHFLILIRHQLHHRLLRIDLVKDLPPTGIMPHELTQIVTADTERLSLLGRLQHVNY